MRNVINDPSLSYVQKRDILQDKVSFLIKTLTDTIQELEEKKKDSAKY
jgi:hypothetical protein